MRQERRKNGRAASSSSPPPTSQTANAQQGFMSSPVFIVFGAIDFFFPLFFFAIVVLESGSPMNQRCSHVRGHDSMIDVDYYGVVRRMRQVRTARESTVRIERAQDRRIRARDERGSENLAAIVSDGPGINLRRWDFVYPLPALGRGNKLMNPPKNKTKRQ